MVCVPSKPFSYEHDNILFWLDRDVETGIDGYAAGVQISYMLKIPHCSQETHLVHCLCIWLNSYCDHGADCDMVMTASDGQAVRLTTYKMNDQKTDKQMGNDLVKCASAGLLRCAVEILIPRSVIFHERSTGRHKTCHVSVC